MNDNAMGTEMDYGINSGASFFGSPPDSESGRPPTGEVLVHRPINIVSVWIVTESGCNPSEGEYGLVLSDFIGGLDLNAVGGVDDISLIKDAIAEIDFSKLPDEGSTQVILRESGEWEDVFWHKYYIVDRICYIKS